MNDPAVPLVDRTAPEGSMIAYRRAHGTTEQ